MEKGFVMVNSTEQIISNLDFSMAAGDLPLTEEDKTLLRNCINSNQNVNQVLRDIVKKNNGTGRGMSN
jgi:hypothetical protein